MYPTRSTHITKPTTQGFSFVEVLVTAALVGLVFGGLFAAVQAMITLIGESKAKAGATALAVERLEYIRSLQYDDVGTISGVPAGAIPQTSTSTLNGVIYDERVLIEYVDDESDGFGGADTNGILADYKRIKVELSWRNRQGTSSIALVSTVVPQGIESTAGGGTIRTYVYDADSLPVAGASVRFVNDTGTSSIDTTRFTDASGIAYLGGAPALSSYEIYVSRAGYSSDSTYVATGTLSSPIRPLVSVVESTISTETFFIDEVSDLYIRTQGEPTYDDFTDPFADTSLIATSSRSTVSGGEVTLDFSGTYVASSTLTSTSSAPSPLAGWYSVAFTATTTASTAVAVQVLYDDGSGLALIPDGDLPGNSSGFTSTPIDLTGLDETTYDTLALAGTLSTIDDTETPNLGDWTLTYITNQTDLSGVPVSVRGDKSIGTDAGAAPVYKFDNDYTTDGDGEIDIIDIEYDVYTVTVDDPTYDVLEACSNSPVVLNPDTSETVLLTLANLAGAFLRVVVTDPGGVVIPNATVRLQNTGYDVTQTTSLCGQTYFNGGGLYQAGDYTLTVSKSGYTTEVNATTTVAATSTEVVQISS